MSTAIQEPRPAHRDEPRFETLDRSRGTWGMALFITTEALLFVMLFFTYIYLAGGSLVWHDQEPPKLAMALTMLAILLVSSAVLHWGEKKLREEQPGSARIAVAATVALGVVFMVLQVLEYKDHLRKLTPQTNAYGSIFYTITSFHGLHLMFGLAMLLFVVVLPRYEPVRVPPHRAYHNAAMYWHFVDAIWVIVVALLYLAPNLART